MWWDLCVDSLSFSCILFPKRRFETQLAGAGINTAKEGIEPLGYLLSGFFMPAFQVIADFILNLQGD